jgi:hypothetical protein
MIAQAGGAALKIRLTQDLAMIMAVDQVGIVGLGILYLFDFFHFKI